MECRMPSDNLPPKETSLHISTPPYRTPQIQTPAYKKVFSAPACTTSLWWLEPKTKGTSTKYCSSAKQKGNALNAPSVHPPNPLTQYLHAISAVTASESLISAPRLNMDLVCIRETIFA